MFDLVAERNWSSRAEEMECEETARYPSREALGGGSGQEIDPSNCPPAHSALLPDTCIDLTGRYGHRFAALLSTPALFTSLCLQTKAVQHRLHLMGALLLLPCYHPPSPPVPQPLLWVSSRYEPSGGAGGLISGTILGPAQTCWHTSPMSGGDGEAKSSQQRRINTL